MKDGGGALWADTDPQFLVMHEEPSGAECLPSIEQAIRQWLCATGGGARQGEAGAGVVVVVVVLLLLWWWWWLQGHR